MKLDIVFTRSKKFFPIGSWLIMLWTQKPYSHVARSLVVKDWGEAFFQANEGKVNYEHERIFLNKHRIVYRYSIDIPKDTYYKISEECYRESGQPYGFLQNIGIAIVDLIKLFGKNIKNPFKRGKNCSELLYTEIFKVLYPELDYDPETIKPHDIENIIKEKIYGKKG